MKRIILLTTLLLPACASITTGSTQSILVETTPKGAECKLSNEKGSWLVKDTPASATVSKASGPMTIACTKGKLSGSASVESTTEGATFGNILAGGIIGAAIDMSNGSAYKYPASVLVKLGRN